MHDRGQVRAQPDITSGPEVRQIFKIRTVRKPDVFLPGRRTFRNRKKVKKKKVKKKFQKKISKNFQFSIFFSNFFLYIFLFIYMLKCLKI